jgi:hypothetical protein
MTTPYPDSPTPLSEEDLNTLEWALSFLHWYEKKYKKQRYLHPLEDSDDL